MSTVCDGLPDSTDPRLTAEQLPLSPLLSRVTWQGALALVSAALVERRIVLVSRCAEAAAAACYSLLGLLYPLEWQHVFVPILTTQMANIIGSPSPYIIGITAKQLRAIPADEIGACIVVLLDSGIVACGNGDTPVPEIGNTSAPGSGTDPPSLHRPDLLPSGDRATIMVTADMIAAATMPIPLDDVPLWVAASALYGGIGCEEDPTALLLSPQCTLDRLSPLSPFMTPELQLVSTRLATTLRERRRRVAHARNTMWKAQLPYWKGRTTGLAADNRLPSLLDPGIVAEQQLVDDERYNTLPRKKEPSPSTPKTDDGETPRPKSKASSRTARGVVLCSAGSPDLPSYLHSSSPRRRKSLSQAQGGGGNSMGRRMTLVRTKWRQTLAAGKSISHRIRSSKLGRAMGRNMREHGLLSNAKQSSECPGARLLRELRSAYTRAQADGCFDEMMVRAAFQTFVVSAFGQAFAAVAVTSDAALGKALSDSSTIVDAELAFDPEALHEVVADRCPTLEELMQDGSHSQMLCHWAGVLWREMARLAQGQNSVEVDSMDLAASTGSLPRDATTTRQPHLAPAVQTLLRRKWVQWQQAYESSPPHLDMSDASIEASIDEADTFGECMRQRRLQFEAESPGQRYNFVALEQGDCAIVLTHQQFFTAPIVRSICDLVLEATDLSTNRPMRNYAAHIIPLTFQPVLANAILGAVWCLINRLPKGEPLVAFAALRLLRDCIVLGCPLLRAQAQSFTPLLRFLVHGSYRNRVRAFEAGSSMLCLPDSHAIQTIAQWLEKRGPNKHKVRWATGGALVTHDADATTTDAPVASEAPVSDACAHNFVDWRAQTKLARLRPAPTAWRDSSRSDVRLVPSALVWSTEAAMRPSTWFGVAVMGVLRRPWLRRRTRPSHDLEPPPAAGAQVSFADNRISPTAAAALFVSRHQTRYAEEELQLSARPWPRVRTNHSLPVGGRAGESDGRSERVQAVVQLRSTPCDRTVGEVATLRLVSVAAAEVLELLSETHRYAAARTAASAVQVAADRYVAYSQRAVEEHAVAGVESFSRKYRRTVSSLGIKKRSDCADMLLSQAYLPLPYPLLDLPRRIPSTDSGLVPGAVSEVDVWRERRQKYAAYDARLSTKTDHGRKRHPSMAGTRRIAVGGKLSQPFQALHAQLRPSMAGATDGSTLLMDGGRASAMRGVPDGDLLNVRPSEEPDDFLFSHHRRNRAPTGGTRQPSTDGDLLAFADEGQLSPSVPSALSGPARMQAQSFSETAMVPFDWGFSTPQAVTAPPPTHPTRATCTGQTGSFGPSRPRVGSDASTAHSRHSSVGTSTGWADPFLQPSVGPDVDPFATSNIRTRPQQSRASSPDDLFGIGTGTRASNAGTGGGGANNAAYLAKKRMVMAGFGGGGDIQSQSQGGDKASRNSGSEASSPVSTAGEGAGSGAQERSKRIQSFFSHM